MPDTDNPLLGLRAAIDQVPGLRYADVRRWAGMRERAFQTYLSGNVPNIAPQLALARFIAGQIVARPAADGEWEFVDLWDDSAPQRLAELLARLRDLVAYAGESIGTGPAGTIDEDPPTNLTRTCAETYDAPMPDQDQFDFKEIYPGEGFDEPTRFLHQVSQKKRMKLAVKRRPELRGDAAWLREAIEEKLAREGVPMV